MPDFLRCAVVGSWTRALLLIAAVLAASCRGTSEVPRWGQFEAAFASTVESENPFQDRELFVTFAAPSGREITVRGFWDGGQVWRVRFSPGEEGEWSYVTTVEPANDSGLHRRSGRFTVTEPDDDSEFDRHGPLQVAEAGTFLRHADGTPFFFLADTGWNAALKATPDEWEKYLETRREQGFTAIQWVTTQWRAAPDGDGFGEPAFTGHERITPNTGFFQRLDARVSALEDAGLLSVPVLLWAIGGGPDPDVNPGHSLPEDQAIRLARYMVARWQATSNLWMLGGDGDYRGPRSERWKRIGRGVFGGDAPHDPVVMHPGGMHWILDEFREEEWVDIHGYQSGHGDDGAALRWITEGPPARQWRSEPVRPFINLEPPYERHLAYQSRQPISDLAVRRAMYWSLLNAPTAGVSYGGHGVWGWDDGSGPPTAHPNSGTPLPWREALHMPGAEQARYIRDVFTAIEFWRLRPAQDLLVEQPGQQNAAAFISLAASARQDLFVAYTPAGADIILRPDTGAGLMAVWVNPRDGERFPAIRATTDTGIRFSVPDAGDWVLVLSATALADGSS